MNKNTLTNNTLTTPMFTLSQLKVAGLNSRNLIKKPNGVSTNLFQDYICDWRKKFGDNDAMYNLWSQIATLYPCEKWFYLLFVNVFLFIITIS
jgi:hypothetical protein